MQLRPVLGGRIGRLLPDARTRVGIYDMPRIRLSPFVSLIPVGPRVFVRSDLKSFALSGESLGQFVTRALPLLDGGHGADDIVKAFPDYREESIRGLLADLERRGVVESADRFGTTPSEMRQEELSAFLSFWGAGRSAASPVAKAHVAVIGSTDWAAIACRGLVGAGVGRLTVLETDDAATREAATRTGLVRELRALGSGTVVAQAPLSIEDGSVGPIPDDVTLLIVAVNSNALQLLSAISLTAEKRKLRHLVAYVEGVSAVLGPLVIPGETACWECLRNRRLANEPDFEESAVLASSLLSGQGATPRPLAPPGASGILGGLILMETVKYLTGYAPSQIVGRQLALNVVTYAAKMHDIVRLPWCPVCGGAAGSRGSEASGVDLSTSKDPSEVRARLAGWVDERNGIIRNLVLNSPSPEQPHSVSTATAVIAGAVLSTSHHSEPLIGSGKGTTKVAAMVGAAGEAVERYSASLYRETDLVRASLKALGAGALDPASQCLYLAEQYASPGFPYVPFDPLREISWTKAAWLDSGQPVFVPALVTYFNYRARRGEQFCQVTSSGLAAGATFEDAALRATLELIERDAFMMTWLQRRPPRRMEVGAELGTDILEVISELAELGLDCEVFLLPGDIAIPVVMCVAWGRGKALPAATVALAAHPDPVEATRKAILEQAHVGPYVARLMAEGKEKIPTTAAEVRSLTDHALFYTPRRRLDAFDFVRSTGRRKVALSRLKPSTGSGIDACVKALDAVGLRVAVADVTSPDVRLGPFRVARALGTYLQPIDFGHQQRRLANPRLSGPINPYPHPLA